MERSMFTLLLTLIVSASFVTAYDNTLKLVQLVYRHGDRSPVTSFPKDVYSHYKWPQGFGWLAKEGIQRHYRFGQWLRQRYDGYLNSTYIHKQIQVESSDVNRCLMSAYSNLAGLYPPHGDQVWNNGTNWQPIPVHARPGYEDNTLSITMKCPRYDQVYQEVLNSKEVQDMEKENKRFYDFLSNNSGMSISINNLWRVADTVYIEDLNNMKGNKWVYQKWDNTTVYAELRRLESLQFHLLYQGKELSRLKGGPLLREMIENMQNCTKDCYKLPQMYMFSAHDTTVAALLSALGLFKDFPSPPYAASVIMELHKAASPPNNYYVNIFYKQNETFAQKVTLPGCKSDCPLDDFVRLTKDVVPVNWKKECGYYPHHNEKFHLTTSQIISIVLAGVLIVTLICLVVTCVKLRKGTNLTAYKSFSDVNT